MERLSQLTDFESGSWSGQEATSKVGLAECEVQENTFALAEDPVIWLECY